MNNNHFFVLLIYRTDSKRKEYIIESYFIPTRDDGCDCNVRNYLINADIELIS